MKKILHIRNFGKIKQADIDLQKFVLFVGDNNSGKTYIMQLIYGILDYIRGIHFKLPSNMIIPANIEDFIINNENLDYYVNLLNDNINKNIANIILNVFNKNISIDDIRFEIDMEDYEIDCKIYKNYNILEFFNDSDNDSLSNKDIANVVTQASILDESREKIRSIQSLKFLDDEEIKPEDFVPSLLSNLYTVMFNLNNSPLYLPSSRAGLHLLYKDYFLSKGDYNFHVKQLELFNNKRIVEGFKNDSALTKPIYDYLRFLQKWSLSNRAAENNYKLINFLENHLIDGSYQKNENMEYIPRDSDTSIPLYLSSSMISELIPYYYFICSQDYDITSYLMVDEAESSLHPKKQFELVRLLVRLNNQNKTIIMSTHSDSLAAKINNIVLLSNKFKNKDKNLLKKYNLTKDDLLKNPNIKVYTFSNKGAYSIVDEVPYDRKLGFTFEGFEDALDSLIREAEEIYKD